MTDRAPTPKASADRPLNYANACALLRKALAALDEVTAERDAAVAALSGAIDGTNDLLDTLLRAEKSRAVKSTADAISKAQFGSIRRELDSVADERATAEAALEVAQRENAGLREAAQELTELGHELQASRGAASMAESRLANYGRHHGWCESQKREAACNCGFDEAMREAGNHYYQKKPV